MAAVQSLRTHLIDELVDLLDAEHQLTEALPRLAQSATSKSLRAAFQKHLRETRGHVARLNQALRDLGEAPRSKTCEGMQGLLEEGETLMNKTPTGALRDAVMIAGAQKVEHYEMASYGTARTFARVIGEKAVARLLEQTLKEEKVADRTLTRIAEGSVNEKATEEWQSPGDEEGALLRTAAWAGTTAAYASQKLAKGVRLAGSALGVARNPSAPAGSPRRSRKRSPSPAARPGVRKR
jgi:ferritin-like metal-binding protein YciE